MKVFLVRVHKIANNFSFFDSCNCCYGNETVRIWTQSSLVTFEALWNVERIFFFDGKNASWCWYYQSSALPNMSEHVIDFVIEIGQNWIGWDWIGSHEHDTWIQQNPQKKWRPQWWKTSFVHWFPPKVNTQNSVIISGRCFFPRMPWNRSYKIWHRNAHVISVYFLVRSFHWNLFDARFFSRLSVWIVSITNIAKITPKHVFHSKKISVPID